MTPGDNVFMSGNTGWGDLDPKTVRQAIREEAVEVFREVLRDREAMTTFWSTAFDVAGQRTAEAGGQLLWGAATVLMRKGALALALAAAIYATGGWAALKAWIGSHL